MKVTRWYDKDKKLQVIVQALEKIDKSSKLEMALDLIQMVLFNKSSNADFLIKKINEFKDSYNKRWYDKDETIQFAIELLKYTDEEERDYLLQEIYYGLVQISAE